MDSEHAATDIAEAQTAVFRLFRYRPRSIHEVREKLKSKQFSDAVIHQTVEYFINTHLLDDVLFARAWIQSRLKKPFGVKRIFLELKQKGIEEDTINEVLSATLPDYDEIETVRHLAEKRMRQYRSCDKTTAQRRLFAYLARRGFRQHAIQKVIYAIGKQRS